MSGSIGIYDTATLLGVTSRPLTQPDLFWLRFFPRVVASQTEEIMFDDLGEEDRRLAPFVSPMMQGRVMREQGYVTRSFKPAYLKPKHVVDPSKAIKRMAGEALTGELSPGERFDAHVTDRMMLQRMMISRRWDWMAAQAIINGSVTVSGEDYPEQDVDFNRDSSLTVTLTSNDRWGESSEDPLGDIASARHASFDLAGTPINDLIFGTTAWANFTANTAVAALLNAEVRGSASDFRSSTVMSTGEPFAYEGSIRASAAGVGGELRLWTYRNFYRGTVGGAKVDYMDVNAVVGVGAVDGVQAFGAIMDADAGLAAVPIFPKMWKNQDPSVVYVMSQSAPLMVPLRPNASFKIQTR